MNRVVKILMERDDMTEAEAKNRVKEGREEIYEAIHDEADPQEIEDLFCELFDLEPDYILDIL